MRSNSTHLPGWLVALWVILGALALALALVGHMLGMPRWLAVACGVACVLVVAVWITVRLTRRASRREQVVRYAGDSGIREQARALVRSASEHYLKSLDRRRIRLTPGSALYDRPWYLVMGPSGAGKTTLVEQSGLRIDAAFPVERPPRDAGAIEAIRWLCTNEAVWIDSPGSFLSPSGEPGWRALAEALERQRPARPLDGVVVVLAADQPEQALRDSAAAIRERIAQLASVWGKMVPVDIVMTRIDTIEGYAECVGARKTDREVIGVRVGAGGPVRARWDDHAQRLRDALAQWRVECLGSHAAEERRQRSARFTVEFAASILKVGAVIDELFRESDYTARAVLRTVTFTAVPPGSHAPAASSAVTGGTVEGHFLNPHRGTPAGRTSAPAASVGQFCAGALRAIAVGGGELRDTGRGARARRVRRMAIAAGVGVICAVALLRVAMARVELAGALSELNSATTAWRAARDPGHVLCAAGDIARAVARVDRASGARLLGIPVASAGARSDAQRLADMFSSVVRRIALEPALSITRQTIDRCVSDNIELTASAYDSLYTSLRLYLLLCDPSQAPRLVDDSAGVARQCAARALHVHQEAGVQAPVRAIEDVGAVTALHVNWLARGLVGPNEGAADRIRNARERLARLPGATALYRSVAEEIRRVTPTMGLAALVGREPAVLRTSEEISAMYTGEGFKAWVAPALVRAARGRRTADWVIGEDTRVVADTAGLARALPELYAADACRAWREFLSSVGVREVRSVNEAARDLALLTAGDGELGRLIVSCAQAITIDAPAPPPGVSSLVAKAGFAKGVAKAQEQVADALSMVQAGGPLSSMADLAKRLEALHTADGAAFGVQSYAQDIATLSKVLAQAEAWTPGEMITAMSEGGNPVMNAWLNTRLGLTTAGAGLDSALSGVMVSAVEQAGQVLTTKLAVAINSQWASVVVGPFDAGLAARFPCEGRREEAQYKDVMDFFRPSTGVLWGFVDRTMGPYVVRDATGWRERGEGPVRIRLEPEFLRMLDVAQQIRDVWFAPDAQDRVFGLACEVLAGGRACELEVAGQKVAMAPGAGPGRVRWPVAGAEDAALRVAIADGAVRDISFAGVWALMRLMQSARLTPSGTGAFTATWQVNVQNMYVLPQTIRFTVSGGPNPFAERLFEKFRPPRTVAVVPAS